MEATFDYLGSNFEKGKITFYKWLLEIEISHHYVCHVPYFKKDNNIVFRWNEQHINIPSSNYRIDHVPFISNELRRFCERAAKLLVFS